MYKVESNCHLESVLTKAAGYIDCPIKIDNILGESYNDGWRHKEAHRDT